MFASTQSQSVSEDLHETPSEVLVIIRGHELDAARASLLESQKEVPPTGLALPGRPAPLVGSAGSRRG
jgi:hypothetical protein